jgi:hypothetical protein
VREFRSRGSVRGAVGNDRPYREQMASRPLRPMSGMACKRTLSKSQGRTPSKGITSGVVEIGRRARSCLWPMHNSCVEGCEIASEARWEFRMVPVISGRANTDRRDCRRLHSLIRKSHFSYKSER